MSEMKLSVVLPLLVPTPFLRAMTEFAIRTLRLHADGLFELIVTEADGDWFDPDASKMTVPADPLLKIDKYLRFNPKIGAVRELNAGVDIAEGDLILSTGNDVFAPPHWDTALRQVFAERPDAVLASLSAYEPGAIVGPQQAIDMIVEGFYSPFMCFRRGWRFDEAFIKIYQDSDMVMRVYESGGRAYRTCRAHVHHLLRMTTDHVDPEQHARDLARDERLFYKRWGNSPLAMFGIIRAGFQQFGHEHEARISRIQLHYDPVQEEEGAVK